MKKILLKVTLIFLISSISYAEQFWSNKVDGPKSNEAAINMLEGKKLDPIEGLWFSDGLGTILIFKDQENFKMYIVEGPTNFNGTLEATIFKRGNTYDFIGKVWYQQMDGSYKFGTQGGRLELSGNYFIQKYDSLSEQGVDMDGKYTRVWPKDIYTHNNNIKTANNNSNENSDFSKKFYQLNWFNLDNPKNHWAEVAESNSEVNILETEIYLKGQKQIDAYSQLLFKEPANTNDMLIIDDSSYDYSIYINYINDGYVSKDDWSSNPKELLAEMKKTSKSGVKDVKWVFEPKLSENNYAYYSYEVLWDSGESSLETTILLFGRKGYHNISLVKKIDENFNAKTFEKMAIEFADTINFKEGYRYADYKSGDKTAAVGIGSLVAGTLGVKALAKAGVLAKLLGFAAKFWWIILAPLVFLGGLFNKKSSSGETVSNKTPKKRKSRSRKTD